MNGSLEISELHVEGNDDKYVIAELLERRGIDMSKGNRPLRIVEALTVEKLVDKMPEAIAAASSRPVAFVFDIDASLSQRWALVNDRLNESGVKAPRSCPSDGFVGRRIGYPSNVGVWLMPDCVSNCGKLEDFLSTLVPAGDGLWIHASVSTNEAMRLGAKFREVDQIKAQMYCWLAWQKDPGKPYGTAIKAKFLEHDSTVANMFLSWLDRVFGIAGLGSDTRR